MPFQEAIFTRRIMPQPHSYLQERFCRGFMNFSSFFVCYHKQLQFLRVDRVDRLCDPIAGHRRLFPNRERPPRSAKEFCHLLRAELLD